MFDPNNEHIMRSHIQGDGYVTLIWPKNLAADDLDLMQEIVLLQIRHFRRHAKRREDASAEYDSWFPITARDSHQPEGKPGAISELPSGGHGGLVSGQAQEVPDAPR